MKKKKYLIYFEPYGSANSQEVMLKEKECVGMAYLVDEITGEEWGDDWDDAPKSANAGPPYPENCKGLEIREVKLGEIL